MTDVVSQTQFCNSLFDLADRFDDFIVDLWGVVHDGQHPYPGVLETLTRLKAQGKRVLFLSNAPRPADRAMAVLTRLGVTKDMYFGVITSGEVVRDQLRDGTRFGRKYFYIGPEKDRDILADCPLLTEAKAEDADFAIVTGYDFDDSPQDEKEAHIQACLQFKLPMICANPDRLVVRQNGQRLLCAGIVAERYAALGGQAHFVGKPYGDVYDVCLEKFGDTFHPERVAAIGDSLHTDISGARAKGIYSVLVSGGILSGELGTLPGKLPTRAALEALCVKEGTYPDAVVAAFR